ncbi:MAG: M20 family metallo-hydrolase [Caldilineaceae bacterium]|nr:M20 family metallo-hydrolase [Caldilineaceae bacterium]
MNINADRLLTEIETLARFTEVDTPGWTRRFPSSAYQESRQWLRQRFENAGLTTHIDAAGNLHGRTATDTLPPICAGSHTDTVMGGGRYDGVLGVLGALEAVRTIQEAGIDLRHPLGVIDFLSEEATDYAIACMGSLAMCTGDFNPTWLHRTARNDHGNDIALADAIAIMGGDPERLRQQQPLTQSGEIAAFLEIHIEQGPILEAKGAKLAAVRGIVGIRRAIYQFHGRANHAGTTSMELRHDALAVAAELISTVERIAQAHPGTVGTVGKLDVRPNQGNVIPEEVTMMAEMRSLDMDELDAMWQEFTTGIEPACTKRGVTYESYNETRMNSVLAPAWLHETIHTICQRHDPHTIVIPSGAGHDSNYMSLIAPTAMIFVPSVDGRSHTPEEFTAAEDLVRGVQVLAEALVAIDGRLGE